MTCYQFHKLIDVYCKHWSCWVECMTWCFFFQHHSSFLLVTSVFTKFLPTHIPITWGLISVQTVSWHRVLQHLVW